MGGRHCGQSVIDVDCPGMLGQQVPGVGTLTGAGHHVRITVRRQVGQVPHGVGSDVSGGDRDRGRLERARAGDQVPAQRLSCAGTQVREQGVGDDQPSAGVPPGRGVQHHARLRAVAHSGQFPGELVGLPQARQQA